MLFNKNNNGSLEIQQLTGTFAASNDYSVIATEVVDATRTVAGLVGGAVVADAETKYEAGTADALVDAVRLPVAILAVARHSRNNLVSHDATGSKFKADADEKMPWEWMIVRDDRTQQERWYRALDALYAYLDRVHPACWEQTVSFKRQKSCIVRTLDELEAVYPVEGSRYVFYLLVSLIVEVQGRLKKILGAELWAKITAEPVAEEDQELLGVCQRWAVLSALITAVRRWSLEVFPLSIARRFSPSYQGGSASQLASREEMDAYVGSLSAQVDEARSEIAELMSGENPWEQYDPQPHNDRSNKFFTAQ